MFQVQGYQELYHELLKDNPDLEKVKAENRDLLLYIAKTPVEKDVRKCIHSFVVDILQNKDVKRIEELSEITQNFYHVFGKRLENSTKYAGSSLHSLFIKFAYALRGSSWTQLLLQIYHRRSRKSC